MSGRPDAPEAREIVGRFVEDGALHLVLNRPDRLNAMNNAVRDALLDCLREAAEDPGVRVVVLRGAGGNFSSGGDVTEMGTGSDSSAGRMLKGRRLIEALAGHTKPVVAAVEGYAVGAGFSLALASDFIVASSTARFCMSFISRGLAPDMGATYFLARQVGLFRAKEMAMSGRFVEVEEAHALGLVAAVWEPDVFDERLRDFVRGIAAGPTRALGATRRMIGRAFETDLSAALDMETAVQPLLAATEDHVASVEAFKAKRRPVFRGR